MNLHAHASYPLPRLRGRVREGEHEIAAMTESKKDPVWQVTRTMRSRARSLRRDSTDAERRIWSALRAHRLDGAGFRRQTPIGPYVVDFVCEASKLIVELDGGQHFEAEQQKRDARRDTFLAGKGYRVLRFNNYDVMLNKDGVLEVIAAEIAASPSPTLPRLRGRGRTTVGAKQVRARGEP
jgi:very-short-patch-repair endonuclease